MKDSHTSTSPLPEHSGGSPENVPSGGRPGDRAEVEAWERLGIDGRPFLGTLPEVHPLPPLEFTIEHDEPAAPSKPGDRPTTTREAEAMAEAVARAWRPPAV
jgi:hypothetical protein